MRTKSLIPLLILLGSICVNAQEQKCTLKISELPTAPELFGFRMGMTPAQLKQKVPQVVLPRADNFSVAKTSISPDFDPTMDKVSLAGIRTVSFDFLDDRLTSLWIGYDGSFKWKTIPQFVAGISQSLRLPDAWEPWRVRGQQLRCADFQMTVMIVSEGPSFRIIDSLAEQTIAARRAAKEEQDSAEEEGATAEVVEILADKNAKVYYLETCRPTNEIKDDNRVVFTSPEAAEKAGYKLAQGCQR